MPHAIAARKPRSADSWTRGSDGERKGEGVEGRDAGGPVRGVMTPDPITLPPSALGYDVLNIMLERRIGHLPVVEDGRLVGIITERDLIRVAAMLFEKQLRENDEE